MNETFFVWCAACDGNHTTDEVEFLNVEEDIEGRDVATYRCPDTQTTQKSLVFKGYS